MSEPFYVYLAGPLTDLPCGYQANCYRLDRISLSLIEAGYCTFNPAGDSGECRVSDTPVPTELLQRRSMQQLRALRHLPHGAVYVVETRNREGQESRGVAAEIQEAENLLIPVYYNRADLDLWRIRAQAEVAR